MKLLESGEKVHWTKHAKAKMRHYQLSESRLRRVLKKPDRKELGIAPRTVAIMQITGTKKHPTEIWLMYQIVKSKIPEGKPSASYGAGKNQKHAPYRNKVSGAGSKITKIISAWRYPARSPIGEPPPIPEDILWEIKHEIGNSN